MASREEKSPAPSKPHVLGRKAFAAITAVEGLRLNAAGEKRFSKMGQLSAAQRRAEVIRAYNRPKGR
jgi:hypothetical protein